MKNTIILDFGTSFDELKKHSYHLHWLGGRVVTIILFLLFYYFTENWNVEGLIVMPLALNALFWAAKEFAWFTALTFEEHFAFLRWLRKFKIFQWSKPDWKDWRFSIYGSIPFTSIVYLLISKKR